MKSLTFAILTIVNGFIKISNNNYHNQNIIDQRNPMDPTFPEINLNENIYESDGNSWDSNNLPDENLEINRNDIIRLADQNNINLNFYGRIKQTFHLLLRINPQNQRIVLESLMSICFAIFIFYSSYQAIFTDNFNVFLTNIIHQNYL
jgi:hypothetical protein